MASRYSVKKQSYYSGIIFHERPYLPFTAQYLWDLEEVNKTLIVGLQTALFWMDKWDQLTPERRASIKENLAGIIAESNRLHETKPMVH